MHSIMSCCGCINEFNLITKAFKKRGLEVGYRRLVRFAGFQVQPPALAGAVAAALPAAVVGRPHSAQSRPVTVARFGERPTGERLRRRRA